MYSNFDTVCYTSSYEPELFPGLIYRMVKPRIVLLIFVSGKVVLTGMMWLSVDNFRFNHHNIHLKPLVQMSGFKKPNIFDKHLIFLHKNPGNISKKLSMSFMLSFKFLHYNKFFFPFSPFVNLGAKDRSEIYEAFENIYPILKGFRKQ